MPSVCETPESPPGDYNLAETAHRRLVQITVLCETPKSPPGDYNATLRTASLARLTSGVKHLNPRQGITTARVVTPPRRASLQRCVKHLNPRQGITTAAAHIGRNRRGEV